MSSKRKYERFQGSERVDAARVESSARPRIEVLLDAPGGRRMLAREVIGQA
jgi:hypothetical protein